MKTLLKRPFKAAWQFTSPLRRPFARKFEAIIARGCASTQQPHICQVGEEMSLLMDHLVRELVRLQNKVDRLQEAIESLDSSSNGLGVVGANEFESKRAAG